MPLKYVEIKDTDLVISKLVGIDIYNKQDENIGEISDIVIGDGKSVIGVVASVGGFLGLGTSYVVIDPAWLWQTTTVPGRPMSIRTRMISPRRRSSITTRSRSKPGFERGVAGLSRNHLRKPPFMTHQSEKETPMDWNRVEGNWKQVKGKIKEQWGKLTDDDLDVIDGKRDQLEGKIQERYGYAKDQVNKDIDDWYGRQTW